MLAVTASATDSIDRKAIAGMLMKLFDHWKLSTEEQLDALGFSVTNRAALARYRRGEPISGSRDTLERAGHLLAIHKNLRLLFPSTAIWPTPGSRPATGPSTIARPSR
jgi:hypothetical protein